MSTCRCKKISAESISTVYEYCTIQPIVQVEPQKRPDATSYQLWQSLWQSLRLFNGQHTIGLCKLQIN